jgi:hypothetical protein
VTPTEANTTMPAAAFGSTRALLPADEGIHPAPADQQYWTETVWFAGIVPEEHLGIWVYLHMRANLDIAAAGIWVWDDTSQLPWDCLYANFRWHLPMPQWRDGDITIADDIEVRCLEPFRRHTVRHHGLAGEKIDLEFAACGEPQPVGVGQQSGHLDQSLWVSGSIVLGDRTIDVDGPGMRDRTWSLRTDDHRNERHFYTFGVARDIAFHVQATEDPNGEPRVVGGSITLDGVTRPVVKAARRVVARRDGPPLRLHLELVDDLGRSIEAVGRSMSSIALWAWPPYMVWVSVVQWRVGDVEIWGEDDDTWSLGSLMASRRARGELDDGRR